MLSIGRSHYGQSKGKEGGFMAEFVEAEQFAFLIAIVDLKFALNLDQLW